MCHLSNSSQNDNSLPFLVQPQPIDWANETYALACLAGILAERRIIAEDRLAAERRAIAAGKPVQPRGLSQATVDRILAARRQEVGRG